MISYLDRVFFFSATSIFIQYYCIEDDVSNSGGRALAVSPSPRMHYCRQSTVTACPWRRLTPHQDRQPRPRIASLGATEATIFEPSLEDYCSHHKESGYKWAECDDGLLMCLWIGTGSACMRLSLVPRLLASSGPVDFERGAYRSQNHADAVAHGILRKERKVWRVRMNQFCN